MANITCPECSKKLKVAETSLGKKVRCPKCASIFVAALPATAMAEDTMIPPPAKFDDMEMKPKGKGKPAPAPDEEELLNYAAAEFKDDDGDSPLPAAQPVYPSRLLVNLCVAFLVIAYGAFFALAHPDVNLLPLGLVKPKAANPVPMRGGNQPDGPIRADGKKGGGMHIFGKKIKDKKDEG